MSSFYTFLLLLTCHTVTLQLDKFVFTKNKRPIKHHRQRISKHKLTISDTNFKTPTIYNGIS
ncbi:unknown [Prevotella sp. CAG:891]|nr:unknown [Prevotella sp. CAG:891]